MIYLLLNCDEYLIAHKLADLRAGLGDAEMAGLNTVELGPGQLDPARIAAEASLMPFLADKRLVIVRGYLDALDKRIAASKPVEAEAAPVTEKAGEKAGEKTSRRGARPKAGAAYLEAADLLTRLGDIPATCDLVFIDAAVDKRRALWKGFPLPADDNHPERKIPGLEALVKDKTIALETLATPDAKALPAWVQQHARERKIAINPDAVALLAEFVGPNLRQLDNELEKLSLYAYRRAITAQDVRAMVNDASEEKIWNLTDGLCQRAPRAAMHALEELRRDGEEPLVLLASIARQYRLLIQVKTLQQSGMQDADAIAQRLRQSPFPVKKALALTARFSLGELADILDRLLEADMAIKTGADKDVVIDVLTAELSQPRRP